MLVVCLPAKREGCLPSTRSQEAGRSSLRGRKAIACQIWYSGINLREFKRDFPRELHADKRVDFLDDDALTLGAVPDGQVDVIVSDPPWGEYDDVGMPYAEFARAMVKSFSRVLSKSKGRFVVLTSRKTAAIVEREFVNRRVLR